MHRSLRFAHWHDLDQYPFDEDLPFYLQLAQRTGSPILELGCGTGRLVLALACAGYHVTGVENLPTMLSLAQDRVRAADEKTASRIRLLAADFRHLHLEDRFRLAILAVNTFMQIADPAEQAQTLGLIFQHLAPGGLLALDLVHPHPSALAPTQGEVYLDKVLTDPETGQIALKFVARRVDFARQRIDATFIYDEMDRQGHVTRTAVSFPLRYLHRPEAESMLRAAGFVIEGVYGSYELDPYQDEGDRMLFLAKRPDQET